MKKISKKKEEQLLAEKLLIEEVKKDFENRRNERRRFEAQWILNLNFLVGNQYSVVSRTGDIENIEKNYRWQYREVFNHITPIVERRLSKLQTIRPAVNVFPVTSDDRDVKCAKITKKIINSVFNQMVGGTVIALPNCQGKPCQSGSVGKSLQLVQFRHSQRKRLVDP